VKSNRPGITRRQFIGISAGALLLGSAADALVFEPTWVKRRTIRLTAGAASHRVVHFTDLHHKGNRRYLESVVARINRLAPDCVCFTGDIIEDTAHLSEALEILRGIKAPLYGVPGNHDYWANADFDRIAEAFAATGGKWLMDDTVLSQDGRVNLHGATCLKAPVFRPREGLNLLLMHYPYWIERLARLRFDLILAGHSHGGQVRLPFLGSILIPGGVGRYDLGLFQTTSGPLYVNPGIGTFYLNVRFCCRPEITLFEV
jgi:hypothetical protein